ncbi:hypothetical protein [Chamaesiphon sp. OTE_75_metabat_556]|jgi:hypothetical protein|uniref:hypothetical protein n=1 Tax=Chamaesiphon sp. OTE_75_metabat_556 TaxID=2964692 RepID=UPI00286A8EF6|nr:hypothetical protein [Chamaesiphon sp. OTE_75_metabat_556]
MKHISSFFGSVRPMRMFLAMFFATILAFGSGFSALAGQSAVTKGVEQLDKIEEQSKEALDNPANSLKSIEERSQGALNEVQPNAADRDKMYRSSDTKLPVVKQVEKAIDKLKNS